MAQTAHAGKKHIAPRLLLKYQAASYCGVGVECFDRLVKVTPIDLKDGIDQKGKPIFRYDIQDLDKWIDSKKDCITTSVDEILERLGT